MGVTQLPLLLDTNYTYEIPGSQNPAYDNADDVFNASFPTPKDLPGTHYDRRERPDCTTFNFIYCFVIIGTLCILGMMGNTISIIVLQKDHFNKVTLFLFQALAVADNSVLAISFVLLSVIYGFLPYANAAMMSRSAVPFIIKYFHPFAYISHCCTMWITVVLALYRYIAVCQPFKAQKWCTMFRARIQIALIVIVATLFNLPRFFQFDIVISTTIDPETNISVTDFYLRETNIGESSTFGKIYTNVLYTIIAVVIPVIVLVILNGKLIAEIRNVKKRTEAAGHPRMEDDNITLIMVVIIVVLLVCHTPDRLLQIAKDFGSWGATCGGLLFYVLNACNLLIIINSSTNFVVYYLLRRGFRQILIKRLCSIVGSSQSEDEKTEAEHMPLGPQSCQETNASHIIKVNGHSKEYSSLVDSNGHKNSI